MKHMIQFIWSIILMILYGTFLSFCGVWQTWSLKVVILKELCEDSSKNIYFLSSIKVIQVWNNIEVSKLPLKLSSIVKTILKNYLRVKEIFVSFHWFISHVLHQKEPFVEAMWSSLGFSECQMSLFYLCLKTWTEL